jgi:hypothetical protein
MKVGIENKKVRIGAGWKDGLKLQSYCFVIDTHGFQNDFLKGIVPDDAGTSVDTTV